MPIRKSGRPSHVISNMPRGSPVRSAIKPLTTTFVLVPIRVQRPPSTTAQFIGISSLEMLRPCLRAQPRRAGTMRATTGVLFMKAERIPGPIMVRIWAVGSDRGRPSSRSMIVWRAPVRSTAAATTKSAATVIMP